jgi:ABC-type glycerol-3-phosphate transport system substrate-binding protein
LGEDRFARGEKLAVTSPIQGFHVRRGDRIGDKGIVDVGADHMQQKLITYSYYLIIVLGLSGCSGVETPPPRDPEPRPLAGVRLTVGCPDETVRALVVETAGGWASRNGVSSFDTAMYDPDSQDPPRGDVWVLPLSQLPRWADAGQLLKLPSEMTRPGGNLSWQGCLPFYREQLLVWDGSPHAVPLLGDAPVCFYRKDLMAEQRHQDGLFSRGGQTLRKPAEWDWEDYATAAEYFRDALKTPSLASLPESSRELDRLFYLVASSLSRRAVGVSAEARKGATDDDLFTFHFDLESGKPRIADAGFVEATRLLQRLQSCRPAGKQVREPWKEFQDGRAVLCLGDARMLGAFQTKGSPVYDKVGVCPVPGSRQLFTVPQERRTVLQPGQINRVPYIGAGAYVLVVPKQGTQHEIAMQLLAEIAGRGMSQQIVLEPHWGGGATRAEHLDLSWDSWRLEPKATAALSDILRNTINAPILNPLVCMRTPREHEFRRALTARVRAVLLTGKNDDRDAARRTMEAVEDDWLKLIAGKEKEHVQHYRMSLGLIR